MWSSTPGSCPDEGSDSRGARKRRRTPNQYAEPEIEQRARCRSRRFGRRRPLPDRLFSRRCASASASALRIAAVARLGPRRPPDSSLRRPARLPGRDFVYVCRDAGAGGYEAFPDVCRLQRRPADVRLLRRLRPCQPAHGRLAQGRPDRLLPSPPTKAGPGASRRRSTTVPTTTAIRPSSSSLRAGCSAISSPSGQSRAIRRPGTGWARGSSNPTTWAGPGPRRGRFRPIIIAARPSASSRTAA